MPPAPVLNSQQLLAPISGEQPTGINVHQSEEADRYNAVSRVKLRYFNNARDWQQRFVQSCLRAMERPTQSESQSWQTVIEHSISCLTAKSKDLWVSAYLLVALTYRHGFPGFHEGLSFLVQLVKLYGSQLHPAEQPFLELRQVAANLAEALQIAPLTDAAHGSRSRLDFIIASDISQFSAEQLATYLAVGTPLTEQLKSDLAESPVEFLVDLNNTIKSCETSLDEFDREIRAQFPGRNDYANYDNLRKELRACQSLIAPYLEQASSAVPTSAGEADAGPGRTSEFSSTSAGTIQTRQDALRQLEKIASFFQGIEPLSPLPYLIRRAVSWGNMSLPEVLAELLSEDERVKLRDRAGIPLLNDSAGSAT